MQKIVTFQINIKMAKMENTYLVTNEYKNSNRKYEQ